MNIDINIDELISEFDLPKNTADFIVETSVAVVTHEIYRQWTLAASNKLSSTRNVYLNGLQVITNSKFSSTILLAGQLPNMIEKGTTPFDMKMGFMKSPKAKQVTRSTGRGKNKITTTGWYLTIPFRHGTPGIVGDNAAFSGIMPDEIYDIAKGLENNKSIKKADIPSPYDVPQSRKQIDLPNGKNIPEYTHKSSIYEGIQKKSAAYEKVIQNTYISFRRVSDQSDPYSWYHKGFPAYNLLQEALNNTDVETIVENRVDDILSKLGYGK